MTDLADFPAGHYRCILADPAWRTVNYSGHGVPQRAKQQHYSTMTLEEMKALPVERVAAKNCVLFMWVIGSHIPQAIDLAAAWGFEFKTDVFYWLKQRMCDAANQIDWIEDDMEGPVMGMGRWSRKQVEPVYLFTRGKPHRLSGGVRQAMIGPRAQHSRKPAEQYDRIEALCAGPRLELFARNTRPNWDSWGNEVGKLDDLR